MADQKPHKKSSLVEMEFSVVGLAYRLTPSKMQALAGDTPLQAKLVREPKNQADENAVAVYVNEKPYTFQVGYLPRAVAATIAPKLDNGTVEIVEAWLASVDVIHSTGEIVLKARKMKSPQKRVI